MRQTARPWPWLIVFSAFALGSVSAAGGSSALRTLLAVWFLLLCPGLALTGLLRLEDAWAELTLAIALSVALDTLIAGVMLYLGVWSPPAVLAIVVGLSLAGAAVQHARGARDPIAGTPP